jgi:hypothetical protein
VNEFTIIPADNFIWNEDELLQFLIDNQRKSIRIYTREEGCCLTSIGLYKLLDKFSFTSVEIHTTNLVEFHPKYNVTIVPRSYKFFDTNGNYVDFHKWDGSFVFGALYNRAIWHRIGIAGELISDYEKISLINFRSNPHEEDSRKLFELQKLFEVSPSSANKFLNNKNSFPIQLEKVDGYTVGATTRQHTDQLKQFYTKFFIDIVAETFTSGRSFFPTEKTVRPMLMKKPFIIMGSRCFLIHLRQMGFKTFHDFWDEDYDGYDFNIRYHKILELINVISLMTIDELRKMYISMSEILNHNYNLIIDKQIIKNIIYTE